MQSTFEYDLDTLKQVGVQNIEELASVAADYVRQQPIYRTKVVNNALTPQEEGFLRRAGASGVGKDYDQSVINDKLKEAALEYGNLVATAYSQSNVAKNLGVSTSRIRQRTDNLSLYAINTPKGRVYPVWQFTEDGQMVPGLEDILPGLRDDAHPIGVKRFFMGPQVDLEADIDGQSIALSPVDWLKTGHSVKDVKFLLTNI